LLADIKKIQSKIMMQIIVLVVVFILISLAVALVWVDGIDFMKDNHPDYKGEDLFDEEK
jgi:hypothetical protein